MNFLCLNFILFILTLYLATPSYARLLSWKPGSDYPTMILPDIEGKTPFQIVELYKNTVLKAPEFEKIFKKIKFDQIPIGSVTFLPKDQTPHRPDFIVPANRAEHLKYLHKGSRKDIEMQKVISRLRKNGADAYVLPISADLILNDSQAETFREEIATRFKAMLPLGGSDLDPSLYNEPLTHSNADDINLLRDTSEFKMVKKFIETEKGVVYGICRGHQLCGILGKNKLIQDIQKETQIKTDHKESWHKIKIGKDSILYQMIGKDEIEVNSLHHQAVVVSPTSLLKTSATSVEEDGSTLSEAMEFKNGLGMTFQFHPEHMDDETGDKIFRGMVRYSKRFIHSQSKPACQNFLIHR